MNDEFVFAAERVADLDLQIARVSFLAIAAQVAELQRRDAVFFDDVRIPKLFGESTRATVKVVGRVIGGERVVASVEMELRPADAARDASDNGAEIRMRSEVVLQIVEAQHDIHLRAVSAGHPQGGDDAAVVGDVAGEPATVGECEEFYRAAVGKISERAALNGCGGV